MVCQSDSADRLLSAIEYKWGTSPETLSLLLFTR